MPDKKYPISPMSLYKEVVWPHHCQGNLWTDESHHIWILPVPLLRKYQRKTLLWFLNIFSCHPIQQLHQGGEVKSHLGAVLEIILLLLPLLFWNHHFRQINWLHPIWWTKYQKCRACTHLSPLTQFWQYGVLPVGSHCYLYPYVPTYPIRTSTPSSTHPPMTSAYHPSPETTDAQPP